jgi:hypothetical protein
MLTAALVAVLAATASLSAPSAARAAPRSFFGIVPQSILTEDDVRYMRAGRIGTIRIPIGWDSAQPTRTGGFTWEGPDREIATAARQGLDVLPFLSGVPRWVSHQPKRLPIDNARARRGWMRFVRATVERYGPGGDFWREHSPAVAKDGIVIRRPRPVRDWQIWNEANFFYFAFPVSVPRYASLLRISHRAVKAGNRRARVILSGLFGEPDQRGRFGMDAPAFLARLYRVRGIKRFFDGIALHPYAYKVRDLERMVERTRAVVVRNRDPGARLYITEMGWGSDYNPDEVAFEQGIRGQVRELRGAYRYLLRNRHRLNLKAAYWFTWKDAEFFCNFCDSVGLFRQADRFRPKPAWYAFVRITGGRPRP